MSIGYRPIRVALSLSLVLLFADATHAEMVNRLRHHPAPYLALHGEDPVAWQLWDSQTLALARRENRLLFLSIGYFSCHWCHVMQQESYQSEVVAMMLNRAFVPVKVDRELLPALDAALLHFVNETIGYAGWPLNVFLTPEGYPVTGLVYAPRDRFVDVLESLSSRWREDAEAVADEARERYQAMTRPVGETRRLSVPVDGSSYLEAFRRQAMSMADLLAGGFGQQNKFPSVPQLSALVELQRVAPSDELRDFLAMTLFAMATQGIRDQLGGGFFRYTVDPSWQTPHFEKMLYDNALLAELYLDAAEVLDQPMLRAVGDDTLRFMTAELSGDSGAFIASLSAVDGSGSEGGYYLWDESTLETNLNPEERRVLAEGWGMQGKPTHAGGYLPVQTARSEEVARRLAIGPARVRDLMRSATTKLLAARRLRALPADDKRLAGWNGLALSALVKGGETHAAAARETRDYLVEELWSGDSLSRARSKEGSMGDPALEDYAYFARGLLDWGRETDSAEDLELARRVAEQAWQRFHGPLGWRHAERLAIPIGVAEPILADGPTPSPSAILIEVSLEIGERLGDPQLYTRALNALLVDSDALVDAPFFYPSHIRLLGRMSVARDTLIFGGSQI